MQGLPFSARLFGWALMRRFAQRGRGPTTSVVSSGCARRSAPGGGQRVIGPSLAHGPTAVFMSLWISEAVSVRL